VKLNLCPVFSPFLLFMAGKRAKSGPDAHGKMIWQFQPLALEEKTRQAARIEGKNRDNRKQNDKESFNQPENQ